MTRRREPTLRKSWVCRDLIHQARIAATVLPQHLLQIATARKKQKKVPKNRKVGTNYGILMSIKIDLLTSQAGGCGEFKIPLHNLTWKGGVTKMPVYTRSP